MFHGATVQFVLMMMASDGRGMATGLSMPRLHQLAVPAPNTSGLYKPAGTHVIVASLYQLMSLDYPIYDLDIHHGS